MHARTRCRDKGYPKTPSPVQLEFQDLIQTERMLICRAFPIRQVYLKPWFGLYKGHALSQCSKHS